jgi:hypothetical protein
MASVDEIRALFPSIRASSWAFFENAGGSQGAFCISGEISLVFVLV